MIGLRYGPLSSLWLPRSWFDGNHTITVHTHPPPHTRKQALDRHGQTVPCLVRVRYMFLNQGSYCAMVVSFFPLPAAITEVGH